ncbi:MAG: antibiotic biosynthesis monooxygenase [Candidatus Korobacteraceae bacterium]
MSTSRIRLLVDLNIHEGKFAEFEAVAKQMAEVSAKEPGTLGYHFVLSADRKRARLVEGYTDDAAITAHFNGPAVQQFVPQMLHSATPTRMEIYGDPGPQVASMAAAFGAEIFTAWEGFDR